MKTSEAPCPEIRNPLVVYLMNRKQRVSPFHRKARLFINLSMRIRALFPTSATSHGLAEQALRRMPLFTEWIGASYLEVIFAWQSILSTAGTPSSGTSVFRCFSLIQLYERILRRIRLSHFCTLINIVTESAIVPWRTLPVVLLLTTISKNSWYTVVSPDSWPRRSSQNFRFWLQSSYFEFPARYFSSPWSSICGNQVQLSSDESPSHTIPIRSWIS